MRQPLAAAEVAPEGIGHELQHPIARRYSKSGNLLPCQIGDHKQQVANLVLPLVLAAIRGNVTLGEIAGAWREEFGEHKPSRAF